MGSLIENLHSSQWQRLLREEFEQPYVQSLDLFLRSEKQAGRSYYPQDNQIFAAFNATEPSNLKAIILGQDPYHGPNQAHGLSFSVPHGQAIPPSLSNIYKELKADLNIEPPEHGNLQSWAEQGVLLLNSILTVSAGQAASHQNKGWERFTDQVLRSVCARSDRLVILLWGAYAQKKGQFIDRQQHCVLEAPHPSPLSAYRGFFGCRHFSLSNAFLKSKGRTEIDWRVQ